MSGATAGRRTWSRCGRAATSRGSAAGSGSGDSGVAAEPGQDPVVGAARIAGAVESSMVRVVRLTRLTRQRPTAPVSRYRPPRPRASRSDPSAHGSPRHPSRPGECDRVAYQVRLSGPLSTWENRGSAYQARALAHYGSRTHHERGQPDPAGRTRGRRLEQAGPPPVRCGRGASSRPGRGRPGAEGGAARPGGRALCGTCRVPGTRGGSCGVPGGVVPGAGRSVRPGPGADGCR